VPQSTVYEAEQVAADSIRYVIGPYLLS